VNIYDVELNMPALLTGRLEVREVSRGRAAMIVDISELGRSMGLPEGTLTADADQLFLTEAGEKTQYVVKVSGENEVSIEPFQGYMESEDSAQNPEVGVYTVVFPSLPMESELRNARIEGGEVVLEMSIPVWEGYL
jgi:hypothetical protein